MTRVVMTRTSRRRRRSPLVVALYVNAGLLAALLVAVVSRGQGVGSAAVAAGPAGAAAPLPQAIAGGNGVYLMPGQFAQFTWGCYVLDVDRQTLSAYEYLAGTHQLKLASARYIGYDRQLQEYTTTPSVEEMKRLTLMGGQAVRGSAATAPADVGPNGERPPTRPPRPGDPDYSPTADDINKPANPNP